MSRYQCPLCQGRHRGEDLPRCPHHSASYDPACGTCRTVADRTPCGGGR
ncbi:hypothetical protein [Planomonospora alba]